MIDRSVTRRPIVSIEGQRPRGGTMSSRLLTPVALALLLVFAVSSAGLAQRVGWETQTRSYSVVLQVALVDPTLMPAQTAPPIQVMSRPTGSALGTASGMDSEGSFSVYAIPEPGVISPPNRIAPGTGLEAIPPARALIPTI